jgi:hypothetical protein
MHTRVCWAIQIHREKNPHGCSVIIKICTEDTIDIRRYKGTRNSYKYDLLAPPSTRRIRNENTKSVLSSTYHNLWLETIYIYIYMCVCLCVCVCVCSFLILTQAKLSVMLLCININFHFFVDLHTTLLYHRQYNSRFYQIFKHWCKSYGLSYDIECNGHYT